jgi:hypothetical protein
MNLQEHIRKVLREELNESTYFRRRVDMSSLDKKFFTNLNIVTDKYLKRHDGYCSFNVFRTTVISYLIDDYRDNLSDEDYDNFPYDEVYNFLFNLFYDKIKDRYVEVFGGDINESKNIRRVLREEINNETFNPHNENYLDAWLGVGDEDMESYEDYGINTIGRIIDEVKELKFPLRIYRGINTLDKQGKHNLVDDLKYDNVSWSTSRYVSEKFGNIVYTGIIDSADDIDLDYTIYRRILHKPLDENEIVMKDNRLIKNLKRFK